MQKQIIFTQMFTQCDSYLAIITHVHFLKSNFFMLTLWITFVLMCLLWFSFQYIVAALFNAHGQCDQIFAQVGDGRLQQRKPSGRFEKITQIWENRVLAGSKICSW